MKKLILLTYSFPPLATGGTQSAINMCKYLPENGWDVIPVTVKQPTGMDVDESTLRSIPESTRVVRIAHGSARTASASNPAGTRLPEQFRKILAFIRNNYIWVPDRVITWRRQVLPVLAKLIAEEKPDCIVSRGPHHSLHLIARMTAKQFDLPYIPFFGDLWIEDSNVNWPSKLNLLVESTMERLVVKDAAGLMATTEGSTGYFIEKYCDLCPQTFIAENAYDPDRMGDPAPPREKLDSLTAGWTGNFFSNQTPDALFAGLELYYGRNPDSPLRLKLAGGIDQVSLNRLNRKPFSGRVEHLGRLQWSDTPAFQKSCDLLIGFLAGNPGSERKNSRKTGEYLISGKPILGIVPPSGDMASRIVDYGRGYIVAPQPEEIAIGLEELVYQWVTSTLNTPVNFREIERVFSAPTAMQRMAAFLNGIAAP